MILYTTETCPLCKVAKIKLIESGMKFEICNDEKVMQKKNIISVPILEKDGQMLNFNEIIKLTKGGSK